VRAQASHIVRVLPALWSRPGVCFIHKICTACAHLVLTLALPDCTLRPGWIRPSVAGLGLHPDVVSPLMQSKGGSKGREVDLWAAMATIPVAEGCLSPPLRFFGRALSRSPPTPLHRGVCVLPDLCGPSQLKRE